MFEHGFPGQEIPQKTGGFPKKPGDSPVSRGIQFSRAGAGGAAGAAGATGGAAVAGAVGAAGAAGAGAGAADYSLSAN
eukprot:3822190-Karenia_brevis.AAC.1